MKNQITKFLFLTVLVTFAISAINLAEATETRLSSMGGVGYFTRDNSNIFYFPGTINNYGGQVVAELRTKNTQSSYTIGGNFGFSEDKVFGAYLNRPIGVSIPDFVFNYIQNIDNVELNNTTDLLIGMPLGNMDFGARLSMAFDGYKQDSTATDVGDDESSRYINLGLGLSSDKMDAGVYIEMPSIKSAEDNGLEDKLSGSGFGGIFRTFMGDQTQIVPIGLVNLASVTYEQTVNNVTSKVKFSNMNLALGAGLNYYISENAMLVAAVEAIGMSKFKSEVSGGTETNITTMDLPGLYMGAESQINKWLTGRIGAVQVIQTTTTKTKPQGGPESETSERLKQFHVAFGVGVALGDFTLDLSFNEGLLFDGPNFISGTNETIADKISITYEF